MSTGIAMPPEVARQRAAGEARKVFRLQVALSILGNEGIHKLAASSKSGAAAAHALIERSTQVALAYMNED